MQNEEETLYVAILDDAEKKFVEVFSTHREAYFWGIRQASVASKNAVFSIYPRKLDEETRKREKFLALKNAKLADEKD